MKVFAVIGTGGNAALTASVTRNFPDQWFLIAPGQYLVAGWGQSAREVGARIGDQGEVGQVFILPFENYHGWHRKELWDWVASRAVV